MKVLVGRVELLEAVLDEILPLRQHDELDRAVDAGSAARAAAAGARAALIPALRFRRSGDSRDLWSAQLQSQDRGCRRSDTVASCRTAADSGRGYNSRIGLSIANRHEHSRQTRRQRTLDRARAAALRDRGEPVRRPRRRDQHHAPADPGAGRRGHPSRPQPRGRGRRARGAAGRRRRDRGVVVPGRPRRILQVHGRHAEAARRRARARVRRRRRHDHAGRDRRAAGLRRRAHLPSERRHAPRPRRDDRGRRAPRAGTSPRRPNVRRASRSTTKSRSARCCRSSRTARSTNPSSRACARNGSSRAARRRSSASPAPAAPASRASSTNCCCASCMRFPRCASPCSRSIRRGAAPAARCSAIASA